VVSDIVSIFVPIYLLNKTIGRLNLGLLGASPEAAAIGSATSRCTLALQNSTNTYIHRSLANKIAKVIMS